MEILYVRGCPYEDNEGEVLNLYIRLDEGDVLTEGGNIQIEMMNDSVIEREVKIINPKWAGDYAAVCEEAKQWQQSGETLKEIKGPGEWNIVVMHVPYHEVKTEEEIRSVWGYMSILLNREQLCADHIHILTDFITGTGILGNMC